MLHRGHSGDGCDFASTLCKYDLGKGDLCVLSCMEVGEVWCRMCSDIYIYIYIYIYEFQYLTIITPPLKLIVIVFIF